MLIIGEVVSAFDKRVRLKFVTKEEATISINDFINDIKELKNAIILEDTNTIRMIAAVDYVIKHHLTVNDALHLHTALLNKNKTDEFIYSDKRLHEAAMKEELKVFDPEE